VSLVDEKKSLSLQEKVSFQKGVENKGKNLILRQGIFPKNSEGRGEKSANEMTL
jgi:hypothetical protein